MNTGPSYAPPQVKWLEKLVVFGAVAVVALVVMLVMQRGGPAMATATPVVDRPTIMPVGDVTTEEDTAVTIRIALSDGGEGTNEVVLTGRSTNPELLRDADIQFEGTGATRTLKLMPAADRFGTAMVTLSSGDGMVREETFRLTVKPVNDAPTLDPIPDVVVSRDPTLIRPGAVWRYLDDGSDAGVAWRETGFDDEEWRSGPAVLGYGDSQTTEIRYGPESGKKHITTYFRHRFTVADPASYSSLKVALRRDDGGVVYLNGNEVFRSGMPDGAIDFGTYATTTAGDSQEREFFSGDVDPGLLLAGVNVVAVEIHQVNPSSSDISFDLELTGELAPSAELRLGLGGIGPGATNETADPLSISANSNDPEVMAVTEVQYRNPASAATLVLTTGRPGKAGVTVLLSDGQGANGSVQREFTAYVNRPGNQLPTIVTAGSGEVRGRLIELTLGDAETAAEELEMSVRSSDPSRVPNENLVVTGEGARRTIEAKPVDGAEGRVTIMVQVVDGGFGMARASFDVEVGGGE